MTAWVVEDLRPEDEPQWRALHRAYLEFYESDRVGEINDIVWGWVSSPDHEVRSIVLRPADGGPAMGLANYRGYPRPISGTYGCYLDDLFVAPEARGSGAVDALLAELQHRARVHGWENIRWITSEGNARARSAYDRLAAKTDLVTYSLAAAPDHTGTPRD